jgi:branched-chain amino acid transport system permease protein
MAGMVEMVYHLQLNPALGPQMRYLGVPISARSPDAWFGCVLILVVGVVLFDLSRRHFKRQWDVIQEEIEKEIKRRESL